MPEKYVQDIRNAELDYHKLKEDLKNARAKFEVNRSLVSELKLKTVEMETEVIKIKHRIKYYTEILKAKKQTYETVQDAVVISQLILEKVQKESKQCHTKTTYKGITETTPQLVPMNLNILKRDYENLEKKVNQNFDNLKKMSGELKNMFSFE